jgi:hypothetical protein
MKLRIALLALVTAAGMTAGIAVAKPPTGHGNPHQGSTPGSTPGTTTTTAKNAKVLVCHKLGNGHYVLVKVSAKSAPAKSKHTGDVPATNGTCPGPIQGHTGTGTGEQTTTTAPTTTS